MHHRALTTYSLHLAHTVARPGERALGAPKPDPSEGGYPSHPGGSDRSNRLKTRHITFSTRHTSDFYNSPYFRPRLLFAAKKKSIATKVETGFAVSYRKQTTAPPPDRNKFEVLRASIWKRSRGTSERWRTAYRGRRRSDTSCGRRCSSRDGCGTADPWEAEGGPS
jgi:hypothetical protein